MGEGKSRKLQGLFLYSEKLREGCGKLPGAIVKLQGFCMKLSGTLLSSGCLIYFVLIFFLYLIILRFKMQFKTMSSCFIKRSLVLKQMLICPRRTVHLSSIATSNDVTDGRKGIALILSVEKYRGIQILYNNECYKLKGTTPIEKFFCVGIVCINKF